jgi:hypothetical protein
MFIDLAPMLSRYSPLLATKCTTEMKEWLSPAGDLSKSYLATLEAQTTPIYAGQAYARMAYAFYLAKDNSVDWRPWFEKAARSSAQQLFSSELAFLLDITFQYKGELNRQ